MIVCFIRRDDTESWNKKCSNPLPVPSHPPELLPCPHTSQELSNPFLEACMEQSCMFCATSVSNSCQQCTNRDFYLFIA